jgi:pimeloyl-ACP methyl ester carboxylesterase
MLIRSIVRATNSRRLPRLCRFASASPRDPDRQSLTLSSGEKIFFTVEEPDAPAAAATAASVPATVVCLHGAPGSIFDWRYIAPGLTGNGHRVVRIDLPGHGLSPQSLLGDASRHRPTCLAMVPPLFELLGGLPPSVLGGAPPLLLAHSLGGETALTMAAQALAHSDLSKDPEVAAHQEGEAGTASGAAWSGGVAGVVLISPVSQRPHAALTLGGRLSSNFAALLAPVFQRSGSRAWARRLLDGAAKRISVLAGFPERVPAAEYGWMVHRAGLIDFGRQRANVSALRAARLPVLLFHGGRDALFEQAVHRELEQALGLARWELPGGGETCSGVREGVQEGQEGPGPGQGASCFFPSGTHYTIKTHANEIASAVHVWASGLPAPL